MTADRGGARRMAGMAVLLGMAWTAGAPVAAGAQLGWDGDGWTVEAAEHRVEEHLGREALFMRNGTAWLADSSFRDGVVEFDLAASDQQGFHGLRFRAAGPRDHEHVYLRPHLSGQPDAVQYTPVFQGVSGWQLYAEPGYVRRVEIPADRWVRVRVVVLDGRMEMTVDGGEPLVFPALVRPPVAGGLGLATSASPARFPNVVVRPGRQVAEALLSGGGTEPTAAAEGAASDEDRPVARWRISRPIPEARVAGRPRLPEVGDPAGWQEVGTDHRDMVNLARWARLTDEANTALAAVTLRADEARTVPARVAFSDRGRIFLNGRQLWAGSDGWSSRDYRFLGTAGFWDTVFLSLQAGENRLVLAVSEDFGGWVAGLRLPPGVEAIP